MIKLLIGGSPCTFWSIAQKNNRETEAKGLGWELFKNYLVAKEKFKPDFFLYENNKSAAQAIKDQIKQELIVYDGTMLMEDSGARYIEINSALVSAQNRQRFYVHNCGEVEQPKDRKILLKDILETINSFGTLQKGKSRTLTAGYSSKSTRDFLKDITTNGQLGTTGVAEPVNITADGKSQTIKAQYHKTGTVNICCYTSTYGATGVAVPITETKDGKSFALTSNYQFMSPYPNDYAAHSIEKSVKPIVAVPFIGQQTPSNIYEVKDGKITIKDKQYPIKLADGYYIIRKLTVTECERLQTMPDGYTSKSGVSASQCYKGLGNGWTAEVIKHILSNALKDIPKDEEIVVLSMYDGIGTGRYCLDKMGFTNVKYFAYEIDKYAMQIAKYNYPDIIEMGDAFAVNHPDWTIGY